MKLTEASLQNPLAVALAVGLVLVLGIVSLSRMPVQLFPDIDEPVVSIFTAWRAAAPAEVEAQLIEPQERALRGLPGLEELNAFAGPGGAYVNLRFAVGTDMARTLVDVVGRMNQLPPLPRDAEAPAISLGDNGGGGPNETLSWFFVQLRPGTPGPVESYRREVEELFANGIKTHRVRSEPVLGCAEESSQGGIQILRRLILRKPRSRLFATFPGLEEAVVDTT